MYDLLTCYAECVENLNKIGIRIPTEKIKSVTVKNSYSVGGTTHAIRENGITKSFDIKLSAFLLDERNKYSDLEQTMYHELLHTMPGCFNHGATWKAYAAKVNAAYGTHISRATTRTEIFADESQTNYAIQCVDCGAVTRRTKLSKVITHCDEYRCSLCNGKLKRIK